MRPRIQPPGISVVRRRSAHAQMHAPADAVCRHGSWGESADVNVHRYATLRYATLRYATLRYASREREELACLITRVTGRICGVFYIAGPVGSAFDYL